MVLKIDYDTVKLQSRLKYVIKMTLQNFSIFIPSRNKILVAPQLVFLLKWLLEKIV